MKHIEVNHWIADDGKIIRRKSDNKYFGTGVWLAENDSIDNYKEVKLTKANDYEGLLKK